MFNRKKRLREQGLVCQGTVKRIVKRDLNAPRVIYVAYDVDGVAYELHESMKIRNVAIRFKGFPIGQRKIPVLGNVGSGDTIAVCYDPNKPHRACLRDNIGIQTD